MNHISPGFRASVLTLMLALTGCSGDRFTFPGSSVTPDAPAATPGAPPVSLAGRWLLNSPGHGQCKMTFGSAGPSAANGTIAPEGGCPGKFFTSRKWTYDQAGLAMLDHNSKPLALLSGDGAQYSGKATGGEQVTLTR